MAEPGQHSLPNHILHAPMAFPHQHPGYLYHPASSSSAPPTHPGHPPPQLYSAAALYDHANSSQEQHIGSLADQYARSSTTQRLPPILQVEKQHVTTSATQAASASRRRNDAMFKCPVPGCGSTFTRRFNLRGHLRSHTEERPFVCEWPGCGKGFARQHDCKRHQALHSSKSGSHACAGCGKTFSRMDALNRHLRSDGGAECREVVQSSGASTASARSGRRSESDSPDSDRGSQTPSVA